MSRKRVLIVDDSAVVRQVLTEIVSSDQGLEVLAAVADPVFAFKRMEKEWPDVIISDVEMPRMDGISFIRKLMAERPTPVVVCSSLTEQGAKTTLEAVSAGAVEVVAKPKIGGKKGLTECRQLLLHAIKSAAQARLVNNRPRTRTSSPPKEKLSAEVMLKFSPDGALKETTDRIVAIGTSTGGTQALEEVLTSLPRGVDGMLIVQHMPEKFTAAFAKRLNGICQIEVREAVSGDRVLPGVALIAPGGKHMLLKRDGAQYRVEVKDGPLVSRHRPSVDVLFRSVAKFAGHNAMGIIMTGMGDDGAAGMLEMKRAGARTLAQDEESCVVYGMPREAVKRGGVDLSLDLNEIPNHIISLRSQRQV